jgi:phosphoribosylformimino-5-aminoimidazole carboxamide ribotide isomerase
MEVVPVIDLKGGAVVRASRGDRASYQPIETPLSPTSEPAGVVAGLLALHPFRTLYLADLDAIERRGDHLAIIEQIARRFPNLRLWIDNGAADRKSAETVLERFETASLVIGSESQADAHVVRDLADDPRVILSLDFRGEAFLGPAELHADSVLWPARLIVMTLARVGSGAGPDFARFGEIARRAGSCRLYLAGGLRGRDDLAAVAASGADGILVASALHDGRLNSADLAALAADSKP